MEEKEILENDSIHLPGRTDPRMMSMIVFQRLYHKLRLLDEDNLTNETASSLICEAIDVLPGFHARKGRRNNIIIVRSDARPGHSGEMYVQNAIDSLRILWSDFQKLMDRL